MTTRIYPCTQQELCTVGRVGWNSCLQHVSQFTAFRPKWTALYVADQLDNITLVESMPSEAERNYEANLHHLQLTAEGKVARDLYQKLKRYIIGAYPANQQQIELNAAGQAFFAKASNDDWDAITSLLTSAVNYMDVHLTQLLNNDNMPPGFPAIVATVRTNFIALHATFLDDEETAKIDTASKVNNLNQIYEQLMAMFLDGQEIFKYHEEILSQFVFDQVLILVRGVGTAGIRGSVKNGTNDQPIAGATITVGFDDYSGVSDAEGHYQISPAAAGTYSVTVTAVGFEPFTIPAHVIITGTISTLNILLVPVIEP